MLITVSVGFLSEAVDSVGYVPTLTDVQKSRQDTLYLKENAIGYEDASRKNFLDFTIDGRTYTSYLRLRTFDIFQDGAWSLAEESSQDYYGDYVNPLPDGAFIETNDVEVEINFGRSIRGYYPALPNTHTIFSPSGLDFNEEQHTFSSPDRQNSSYILQATNRVVYETQLDNVDYYGGNFIYIQPSLKSGLSTISRRIDDTGAYPFININNIIDYLHEEYEYSTNYTIPPGSDPLLYLLSSAKKGDDLFFNTALALLLRNAGYPARLVEGYIITPNALHQEVYSEQRCYFVEVPFEDVGWAIFNANPNYDQIRYENVVNEPFLSVTRISPEMWEVTDDENMTLKVLTKADYRNIEGVTVNFYMDGSMIGSSTSDKYGVASLVTTLTEGSHRWHVTVDKLGFRASSSEVSTLSYSPPEEEEPHGESGQDPDDGSGDGNGGTGEESGDGSSDEFQLPSYLHSITRALERGTPPDSELFQLTGVPKTSFLRTFTSNQYEQQWTLSEPLTLSYESAKTIIRGNKDEVHLYVTPLQPMGHFLPMTISAADLSGSNELFYHPDENLYSGDSDFVDTYMLSYNPEDFFIPDLIRDSVDDGVEYDIPQPMYEFIRPFAMQAIQGATSDYDKIKSIETFLKDNYEYTDEFNEAPEGMDPVEWFLEHEKKGTHSSFNSAFALMLQSVGIPARYSEGFLISPDSESQTVNMNQEFSAVEVPFQDSGWLLFNAAEQNQDEEPPEEIEIVVQKKSTFTHILEQDESLVLGEKFSVYGKVTTDGNRLVDGLVCEVFLKEDKEAEGILVGEGLVDGGYYTITCNAPLSLPVGVYQVDVHTKGNELFNESWSDPPIEVYSNTDLNLNPQLRIIADKPFTIIARLNKQGSNIPIDETNCLISVSDQSVETSTDKTGGVSAEFNGLPEGDYTVNAQWDATGYYLGSEQEANLLSIPLTITADEYTQFIRGNDYTLTGRVHAEELSGIDETVNTIINGVHVGSVTTVEQGRFSKQYSVSSDAELGDIQITYQLERNDYQSVIHVKTVARTEIVDLNKEPVNWREPFNISAILRDDNRNPLTNFPLVLTYYSEGSSYNRTALTDSEGEARFYFSLDEKPENSTLEYNLAYGGSNKYLSIRSPGVIHVYTPKAVLPINYIIIAAVIAGSGSGFAYYLGRRPKTPIDDSNKQDETIKLKSLKLIDPSIVKGFEVAPIKTTGELVIDIPQLNDGYPAVWGIGEKLLVNVTLPSSLTQDPKGTLNIRINDWALTESFDETGLYTIEKTFDHPDDYVLTVEYESHDGKYGAKAKTTIPVIDYKDKINSFFNEFYKKSLQLYNILPGLTARELEYNLQTHLPDTYTPPLRTVTSLFEEAKYSTHTIERTKYAEFFDALTTMARGEAV